MEIDEKLVEQMLEDFKDYNINVGPNHLVQALPGHNNTYYIEFWTHGTRYVVDSWIAFKIGVNRFMYEDTMKDRFNAITSEEGICFKSIEDAFSACKWIESIIIMKELVGA